MRRIVMDEECHDGHKDHDEWGGYFDQEDQA